MSTELLAKVNFKGPGEYWVHRPGDRDTLVGTCQTIADLKHGLDEVVEYLFDLDNTVWITKGR